MTPGNTTENIVYGVLVKKGHDIKQNSDYDHKYKLDFIITNFGSIDKFSSVGCQLTANINNLAKMIEFNNIQKSLKIVPKAAYIEIDSPIGISKDVGEFINIAISNYAFNKDFDSVPVIGIKITPDSFTYYDMNKRISELETQQTNNSRKPEIKQQQYHGGKLTMQELLSQGDYLSGIINKYIIHQGYGFITPSNNVTERAFFHIKNIKDTKLANLLSSGELTDAAGYPTKDVYVEFDWINEKGQLQASIKRVINKEILI